MAVIFVPFSVDASLNRTNFLFERQSHCFRVFMADFGRVSAINVGPARSRP